MRVYSLKILLFQFHIKALSSLARLRHLNVLVSTPRHLNPRRLDFIFDLKLVLLLFCLTACSASRTPLAFVPGSSVNTLSAAVSLSITTGEHGMSGSGFLAYRRPDQLHLVVLSPFGTTLLEAFALGEQITLLYPADSTAFRGRFDELPAKSALKGWRLMRWVMDADPASSSSITTVIERSGVLGVQEQVTYDQGLVTAKRTANAEQVYYSGYALVNGVPIATEVDLRIGSEDRIRLVLDEPQVNTVLEDAIFQPQLAGITIRPLSELRGF